ncbi:MAG TPA: YggS family pyridoxal phosphate-dependent enzyme [Chloroflexota bacterium]|jgi:pyridoxal phosphate enzyme (YggS family)|nr:YggS family pyridoxal phosphate-dependent enzyme [Chloroflexota bacterium]
MSLTTTIADQLARVRERIAAAAARAGRDPQRITLVGATKTVEPARIQAAIEAGLRDFGENYVQEARAKLAVPALRAPGVRWHLIGHLQTNKAKTAVGLFDIIQTLDSPRLAVALARHVPPGRRLEVLLEVDYTGAPERTGLRPEAVYATVEQVLGLPALELSGLMTVPAPGLEEAETRATFRRLRALRDELARRYPAVAWRHLSMGMTDDFEWAIEEGATIVRIGRAIFGPRP